MNSIARQRTVRVFSPVKYRGASLGFILSLLFLLWAPAFAKADLTECHGVWTNKPCEDSAGAAKIPTRVLPESKNSKANDPTAAAKVDNSKRNLWYNDLDLKRLKARGEHGVDVDISVARERCLGLLSDSLQCRTEIDKKLREIEERVLTAVNTEAAKKQITEKAPSAPEQQPSQITIIQQNQQNLVQNPRPRPHGRDDWNGKQPIDPNLPPIRPPLPPSSKPNDRPIDKPGDRPARHEIKKNAPVVSKQNTFEKDKLDRSLQSDAQWDAKRVTNEN